MDGEGRADCGLTGESDYQVLFKFFMGVQENEEHQKCAAIPQSWGLRAGAASAGGEDRHCCMRMVLRDRTHAIHCELVK